MKLIKVKKGFTLIETLVTITILFMILAIISPLLNYNLRSLYTTENKSDLQREAYNAVENFTKNAMEARNILEISRDINEPTTSSVKSEKSEQSGIRYIELVRDDGKRCIFKLGTDNILRETINGSTTIDTIIATDLIDIVVKPLSVDVNETKSFDNCSAVRITFKFSKYLVEKPYEVTSEIKLRNN